MGKFLLKYIMMGRKINKVKEYMKRIASVRKINGEIIRGFTDLKNRKPANLIQIFRFFFTLKNNIILEEKIFGRF